MELIEVGTVEEVERAGMVVVPAGDRPVLVIAHEGGIHALDNRCPHMGFPLQQGTLRDGVLTCHWHHARFDITSGCTLDPFADDAPSYAVEVRDGRVLLDPEPILERDRARVLNKLDEGLQQRIGLVLAKTALRAGQDLLADELIERTALFGVRNRARGWSTGLSILSALANVSNTLAPADRTLALYHGMLRVAASTAGQPPNFDLDALRTEETRPERFRGWFRRFIDSRSEAAAERTLRTAIHVGVPQPAIVEMVAAASTDHLFMDIGHTLDFANKAFELLDCIGWQHAEEVLPSLIPVMTSASRAEESASWRHPIDLPSLLFPLYEELEALIAEGARHPIAWEGHRDLAETILDAEPEETLGLMRELVRDGVPLAEVSSAVAYAAARRPVHFSTANEFIDWDTIHHTFTYVNAVDQTVRRAPSAAVARGVFDGAMSVYLERFLNVPKRPIPQPSGYTPTTDDLLRLFDEHDRVDETAQVVADMLALDKHDDVVRVLGHAMLREDAGFHQYQIYEAGVRQYRRFAGRPEGDHILIGAARFLTAHAPTMRSVGQTFDIASRLHRGEPIHEDAEVRG